ncbi:MAG: DUF1460 domain-containing protein [Synergistaceae bacterium]|nr:DUF1460 domain-containing protein [Synergistaceae bacterium]
MRIFRIVLIIFVIMWRIAPGSSAFSSILTEDVAKTYLGKPYVSRPLAKSSPLGFDCTTYVEEVLAKRFENPDMALNNIRFGNGGAGFFNRNHFMEKMWIPNAQRHGVIAPINLSGAMESLIEIDLAEWYRVNPEIVIKDDAYYQQANEQERFTASISYIPKALINEALLKELPDETLVFFLRRYAKSPYRWLLNENAVMVKHMGFLFGGRNLYHASQTQKKVIAEDFSKYLRTNSGFCGAAFYKIN